MKALVVYDSVFGHTEQVARAVGQALGSPPDVAVARVSGVTSAQLTGLDLLIVGSPTRQFRATPAITAFLAGIPAGALKGAKVAAFDTRLAPSAIKPRIFRFIVDRGGYAAKIIAAGLSEKGGEMVAPPEGFFVLGEEGPLKEGEVARAAEWARKYCEACQAR